MKEIEYNLHDSIIAKASYKENGRLELDVQLYEIFYPGSPMVKVIISGIFNKEKIESFFEELTNDAEENDWIGYRIDSFKYDEKKQSTGANVYLFLAVDHLDSIKIHCKKLKISVVCPEWH